MRNSTSIPSGGSATTSKSGSGERRDEGSFTMVSRKHPLRWLSALIMLVLASMIVHALFTNQAFGWAIFGKFLFSSQILVGLQNTLVLTVAAMLIGVLLGTLLASMRMSENPVLSTTAGAYLWFFRGTPVLVQLIFWYNLSALYPTLSLGIPFGPAFAGVTTNAVVNVWVAAILGLGLNEAAYMAEIIRGGLLSVGQGQTEAAKALGMSSGLMFRRIILRQALRIIVPPTGNQFIGMLKGTSLVSVIALPELLYTAQIIYSANFQTIPLLVTASIWYLVVTTVLSVGQMFIEKYYGRGSVTSQRSNGGPLRSIYQVVVSLGNRRDRVPSSDEVKDNHGQV